MQELERQQKRAMSIICLGVSYYKALVIISFKELATQTDDTFWHNHCPYKLLLVPH